MILDDVRFIPSRRGLTRSARLLRARRERACGCRPAEKRDELASFLIELHAISPRRAGTTRQDIELAVIRHSPS
jgi:hypothetical protein